MDKPHHIIIYIMDKNHKPVIEGKVGFMIKKDDNYNYVLAKRLNTFKRQ